MNAYQNGKTRIFEVAQSARASTVARVTLAGVHRDVNLRYARVDAASSSPVEPSAGSSTVRTTDRLSSRIATPARAFCASAHSTHRGTERGHEVRFTGPAVLRSLAGPPSWTSTSAAVGTGKECEPS